MYSVWIKINKYLALIAGLMLAFVMIIYVFDLGMRIFFNRAITGIGDIITALLPIFIFLPMAHTEIKDEHIRVEVVTSLLNRRKQIIINMFAMICGIVLLGVFVVFGWGFFCESWQTSEYFPGLLRVPAYPAKFTIVLGYFLLIIQFVINIIRDIVELMQEVQTN